MGDDVLAPGLGWASWDFQPSSWSAGALLVNCADDARAPLLAYAPPGVSLWGESGFATARWRSAWWPTTAAFLRRGEPERTQTLEFDRIFAEIPEDFSGWATAATAAHVERLRALAARPGSCAQAAELAGLLHAELEMGCPGALERAAEESLAEFHALGAGRPWGRRRGRPHFRRPTRRQVLDVGLQAGALLLAYLLYLLVREPWAPRGTQVGLREALALPLGGFTVWLYGLGHVLLPIGFLAWVYFRRPASFAGVRNVMGLAVALAFGAYLVYSPRPVYAAGPAQSVPSAALATMPGLHLAVALALALFGVGLSRSPVARILWLAYPPLVAWVLISTGSRYPEFTIGLAVAILALSFLLARLLAPRLPSALGGPPADAGGEPGAVAEIARR
jgi:hypothetical protein